MIKKNFSIEELELKAKEIRRDIVSMVYNAKSGHIGGSLSIVDILVSLYYGIIRVDPKNPDWEDRDRFVLSKGHTAPAVYATLANRGFFDKELLFTQYRRINSILQGHPDVKKTPGIDMSAGSLGIGLSTACGMALGAKKNNKDFRVYALVGDGELNEGEIWEAAMFASSYKLDNLTVLVDVNGMQNDGFTNEVLDIGDICSKWESFGWSVYSIDGHSIGQIRNTILAAQKDNKPQAIICKTIKGKGVSFMENQIRFHGGCPTEEEFKKAMEELA